MRFHLSDPPAHRRLEAPANRLPASGVRPRHRTCLHPRPKTSETRIRTRQTPRHLSPARRHNLRPWCRKAPVPRQPRPKHPRDRSKPRNLRQIPPRWPEAAEAVLPPKAFSRISEQVSHKRARPTERPLPPKLRHAAKHPTATLTVITPKHRPS